ncbi:MAG: hypothetical protein N4A72_14565 [Bacteroidales bacterium]|jgi:hypothetical protein|nr:hypothetical protein [Bacteroidales bacterium]
MDFKTRIRYLIDNLCDGNKKKFSIATEIPYTSVSEYHSGKKTDPKLSLIIKILNTYKNVNALWLITGKGEIEGKDTMKSTISTTTKQNDSSNDDKDKVIELLLEQITELKQDKEDLKRINNHLLGISNADNQGNKDNESTGLSKESA